jgi:putative hydrolase
VEATLPAWHRLAAPVAASMSNALATVLGEHLGADAEVSLLLPGNPAGLSLEAIGLGDLDPAALLRRLGAAAFGMQIGQAAGTLSREAFGATDLGLPLLAGPGTVLVPANVDAFAGGLSAPIEEVRLFLAVREAAHARLFTHVPWAAGHLLGLVESYARGITIDLNSLEEQVRDIDPANPEELHMAIARGGVFGVPPTADQQATLLRLETALALVEGWVDEVSAQATLAHLPHAIALREMLRRRRAAGGPAEQTFSALVGLELRPRRCRDAASLFAHAYTAGGIEGRDGVWSHPDLLPTPADLDDPAGYLTRREADRMLSDALDDALEDLLRGEEP